MKEKINKSLKFLLFLFINQLLTNCAVEEVGNPQDTVNISAAQNWFNSYQSSTTFSPEFENLSYDWKNSKIEILENDNRAVIVPVLNNTGVDDSKIQKLLYIYPKHDNSFETTLYELISKDPTSEKTDGLKYFSGYVVAYNLEKGFIESTKFENSVAKFTISGDKLPTNGETNIFGKYEIDPQLHLIV